MNAVAPELRRLLVQARNRTLALARDLTGERLLGPRLAIVNPPQWEIGHVGWFQEYWCLRYRRDGPRGPSQMTGADALYDSAAVPHSARWNLPLPSFEDTLRYLDDVLNRVLERIERDGPTQHVRYFAQLAAFHEEMHAEAFTYTRQTLGYPAPRYGAAQAAPHAGAWAGDVEIPGGEFLLGASPGGAAFVFDNEKWAHAVTIAPFRIARAAVTNAQFLEFVADDGYGRRELWSPDGWRWCEQNQARGPVYWRRQDGAWLHRHFDRWVPLRPQAAMIHVSWFEADAWCRWAGRRLPGEAEWEAAAAIDAAAAGGKRTFPWGDTPARPEHANLYGVLGDTADVGGFPAGDSAGGCRQMFGNVWEWTADWFGPYPGFERDPYKEYSEPWFGNHKVLRGGCHATRADLLRNTWRNFYTPERRDVFAGFRSCARNP